MGKQTGWRVAYLVVAVALTQSFDGAAALLPGWALTQANQASRLSLKPCEIPGIEGGARCGVHHVLEDRRARAGRTIPLFVVVLPALDAHAAPDPLFVIAGGPGQAATSMAEFASKAFSGVRRYRDIVLVDMAGTGRSAALQCQMYPTARDLVGDFYPVSQVRACRDSLAQRTDLRRYTTSSAHAPRTRHAPPHFPTSKRSSGRS